MATSVANITAGRPMASGGILAAPLGSTLPTDASTALDAAYVALGLVGEEGLAPSGERSSENTKDWAGDIVAALQSEHTSSFEITLLEVFNEEALKAVFGDGNVTVTAATPSSGKLFSIKETGEPLGHKSFAFDMKYLDKRMRIVLPDAQITAVEEAPFVNAALNSFKITIMAYKDTNNTKVYRYYDDGTFSA